MSVLLDGLMILLFGLCAWSGWRRGFIKMLSGLLALVVASLASSVLSSPIAAAIAPRSPLPPVVVSLLCSIVLFILSYALMTFMLRTLNVVAKLPLLKFANKALGLAVGMASGILWVLFAMGVLYTLAWLGWIPFLTPAVMAKTHLISWLSGLLPAIG